MGHDVGRLGSWPVSVRESGRATRSRQGVRVARSRRKRSDLSIDRQAQRLGRTGAAPVFQRVRNAERDPGRCVCGPAGSGRSVAAETNRRVTFNGGRNAVTLPPGQSAFSDPVALPFVTPASLALLDGRKLAVSFHVAGSSGPMTWHAKALQTSYVSAPGAGSHGADESDAAFPFSTTSWYFLDAVEAQVPDDTQVIACLGDSITDGTGSTLNGDDRWPDILSRRLRSAYGSRFAVVNAGIGGNRITGPTPVRSEDPVRGRSVSARSPRTRRPVSLRALDRHLAGRHQRPVVRRQRRRGDCRDQGRRPPHPRARQLASSWGRSPRRSARPPPQAPPTSTPAARPSTRSSDPAICSTASSISMPRPAIPRTGGLRPEFQPNSSIGGPGDGLHPNRAGYLAMAHAVDLDMISSRACKVGLPMRRLQTPTGRLPGFSRPSSWARDGP